LAEPITGLSLSAGRLSPRGALWLGSLICLLVAEGAASTRSYVWAAPVLAMLVVAVAVYIPLTAFLGATLLVRILTDASLSSPTIRHTGSLNLSGGIALLFILVAAGLLIQRRRGVGLAVAMTLWLCLWTAVAVASHGASTETVREGVRELSIVAVAVIVLNSSNKLSLAPVVRLIQVVGLISALVAVYQLATHTGILINREVRANGTFTHPNGAAMFFAIATIASVWRYWDSGRRRLDLLLAAIFATATVATFSLSGLAALLAMLMAFGSARPGSVRVKFGAYVVAALVVAGFLATPLGGERLANESSTSLQSAQVRGAANTSFAWRLYKWGTLIPQWEQSPYIGQGLGTTVTAEGNSENVTAGRVPHNEYLRYLVETGVIGLAILLGGLVMLIRRLAARRRVPGAPDSGALGIAVVAGCLVNALADNTLLYTTTGYAAALILAAVLVSTASGVRTTGAQVA
jgi:O-antigen ligase